MNALHLAAFNGHEQEVEFLLSLGGKDINSTDSTEPTLYLGLTEWIRESRAVAARERSRGQRPRWRLRKCSPGCVFEGHDKIVQLLLEKGAEVNAQGGHYGNALQAACSGGHDKIVQLLLERGAEVNAQGGDYGNAL